MFANSAWRSIATLADLHEGARVGDVRTGREGQVLVMASSTSGEILVRWSGPAETIWTPWPQVVDALRVEVSR